MAVRLCGCKGARLEQAWYNCRRLELVQMTHFTVVDGEPPWSAVHLCRGALSELRVDIWRQRMTVDSAVPVRSCVPDAMRQVLVALLLVVVSAPSAQSSSAESRPMSPWPQPLEMTFCGLQPEKPPLKKVFFNVTLQNRSKHARWFLLPDALYPKPPSPTNGGIDAVEVYAARSPAKVSIANFMGTFRLQPESAGGFQALLLPAGARVSIRRFTIGYWGDLKSRLPIHLVIADQVTVANLPATAWTGGDLLTDARALVTRDQFQLVRSNHTPDLKEVPVGIVRAEEFNIANALARRCKSTY